MSTARDILVIEDSHHISDMIREILTEQGYNITVACNTTAAFNAITKIRPHLIILDIWLDGNHLDGLGLLKHLKRMMNDVPIIMISGHANVELAANTIRLGAYDFIEKPFNSEKLIVVVKRALETRDLVEINAYLQNPNNSTSIFRVSSGVSKPSHKLRHEIKILSQSNCRVILSGEPGSQPAHVAREIHEQSNRSRKPFLTLSNVSNGDYENILNVITGSDTEQSIFERANGGTLVFENLHTLPLHVQSKILDALQKDCIHRAGKQIKFDVRVMGAFEVKNDVKVIDFVQKRVLNEMLYHRLNVKSMTVPSLKNRIDDVVHLFGLAAKSYLNHATQIDVTPLKHALTSYTWPCNTQELCNAAEYAVMMSKLATSNGITIEMLPQHILGVLRTDFATFANITEYLDKDYKSAKKHFDMEYIKAQLRRFSNNVAKTARFMGVDRAALYRKIRSLVGNQKTGDMKIVHLINRDYSQQEDEETTV